tara:strand:- start:36 stop:230 length:195 start_codon:yes stop_codon:yes gene_type:complete
MTFWKDRTASTTTRGAAKILDCDPEYLALLRRSGKGPRCYQLNEGGHYRYRYIDIEKYQKENEV